MGVSLASCGASLSDQNTLGANPPRTETRDALSSPPGGPNGPASGVSKSAPTSIAAADVPRVGAAKAADAFAATATPGSSAYKIGPQDVLDISVFQVPDLTGSVQVADGGTINLPLVGEVPAAGKTAQALERDLVARLGAKYLQSPQVTVYVKEYNSQRVTIEGAVKKPGVYPIRGENSLLQMIAMAEGLAPASDASNVVVFRQESGKRFAAKFDVGSIRSGRAQDPTVRPGDVIVVNDSAVKAAWQNFLKVLPSAGTFALIL